MSNDNQRLQLSNEQKSGKIRSLENKYVDISQVFKFTRHVKVSSV